MLIGKIVGSVVSTRKNEKLIGSKFMIVEPCANTGNAKRIVAVDNVGAGIGELVLIATGSAARIGEGDSAASRACRRQRGDRTRIGASR